MPDYKGLTAELEFAIENGCDYELIEQALIAITDMRNELCDKCGRYEYEHNGACNGCRWKD